MTQQGYVVEGRATPTYLESLEGDITQVQRDIAVLTKQPVTSRERAYALVGAETILRQLENTRHDYRYLIGLAQTTPEEESTCGTF